MPADMRERIERVQERAGFIPNVFLTLAHRPEEFRAFFQYHDALMLKEGTLSKAEREMIVVATSAANQCTYCVVAHGAVLRIYAKNPLIADQIATNYLKVDLSRGKRRCSTLPSRSRRKVTVSTTRILRCYMHTVSTMRTSGTLARLQRSLHCRIGWRT